MTDEELNGRFANIDQHFEDTRRDIKVEEMATREYIKAEGLITRAHFDAVAEAIKEDVKLIAAGHGTLRERTDRHEVRLDKLELHQARVGLRVRALEYRRARRKKGR